MDSATAIREDVAARREESAKRRGVSAGIIPAKQKSIAVLTPTLGRVSMWWTTAIMDLVWPMNTGKAVIPAWDRQGGQVGEMRNRLVKMAMDFADQQGIDLDSVMWIDDDVIFNRFCLLTLCSHDRDIASGVYFCKGEFGDPLIFNGPSSGTAKFRPDETFECWGYSQGLSLVKTSVYRRMMEELDLGKDQYGNPQWYKKPDVGMTDNGQMTMGGTEDFHFFDLASKLGIRPLVDCTKFAFGFHYDLAGNLAYPVKQWEQYLKREPIVWSIRGKEVVWS